MTLSTDERRALAIIAGLLVAASGARWLERPQPLLEDVPALDVAALEEESRAARPDPAIGSTGQGRSAGRGSATSGAGGAARPPDRLIDPNTATAAELDRLPGVGPSLAVRIIEERERGPFTSAEDLTRVRGIGAALATRLAGHVSLPARSAQSRHTAVAGLTPVKATPADVPETALNGPSDINYISAADLQKVRGVGPVLADRLVTRRDSLGRFRSWEQVDEVTGVGPAMLARLKEKLVLRP